MHGAKVANLSGACCQQQLEENEEILNGISDVIMLLDSKTYKILEVNQAFLDHYMVNRDQVRNKTCYQITHRRRKPCSQFSDHIICPLEQTVETGNISKVEHTHKNNEGKKFYFEIDAYPLKDINDRVERVIHLSRDVTPYKLAEEALKEKVSKSEHLAAIGQLVAEISHEIKNPLMMIGGFTNQLIEQTRDKKSLKKLNIIADEVSRLETIVKELKELYLPRSLDIVEIDINSMIEEIYSLVKYDCEEKGIRIEIKKEQKPVIVEADITRLKQVILNLVTNAMEVMENGGNLLIQSSLVEGVVEITIADDGDGISENVKEKIFSPFFTTKKDGTGLGLSISKKIIDEHKGSALSFQSQKNGTVFKITMPVFLQKSQEAHYR